MHYTDTLSGILERQKTELAALEEAVLALKDADLTKENEALRQEAETLHQQNDALALEHTQLKDENQHLKEALYEQMLRERMGFINDSKKRLAFYFKNADLHASHKLAEAEDKYEQLLQTLKASLTEDLRKNEPALLQQINEAETAVQQALLAIKTLNQKKLQALSEAMGDDYEQLAAEDLPPGTMESRMRRFNLEMRFGSKIVNLLGVTLILLGVVFGLQYTYVNLLRSNELKGAAAYLLGVLFLAGGEFLQRSPKTRGSFSIGITAGGISILYASTAISHFNLHILSVYPALALCVAVSVLAFLLSLRYNAKIIACFALAGGYIPLFALPSETLAVNVAFIYFSLLHLFALLLATQKKWPVVNGLGFGLYALGAFLLLVRFRDSISYGAGAAYFSFSFLLFLAAVLAYPIIRKVSLTRSDVLILSANTLVNCILLYALLNSGHKTFDYNGALAIGFFAVYFAGAKLTDRFLGTDKRVSALFYLTAFMFAVLIVPLQFGLDWLLIGWLAEGILLLIYGVLRQEKWFERAGWPMVAMAAIAFIPEATYYFWQAETRFFVNFSFLTIGLIGIAAAYYFAFRSDAAFDRSLKDKLLAVYRYALAVFTFIYVLYAAAFIYTKASARIASTPPSEWLVILLIMCTFIYGAAVKYIPGLRTKIGTRLSLGISLLAIIVTLLLNAFPLYPYDYPKATLGLLIMFNLFSVAAVYECSRSVRLLSRRPLSWLPLAVSLYALILVAQTLMVQYAYSLNSILLSAIGMVASLLWIWGGFVKRNRIMRLFGLGFAIFSTTKLFLMDLAFLESILRIASYFIFGVVLLGISFIYQFFNKKINASMDMEALGDKHKL